MATRERRWYIFGCYLVPRYGATIWDVEAGMAEQPRGIDLIVAGYLNVDLERTGEKGKDKEITVVVATEGLEDLLVHFFPRQRSCNRDHKTWAKVRQGREVRSWTDYIMGSDRRIFQNVDVRYP